MVGVNGQPGLYARLAQIEQRLRGFHLVLCHLKMLACQQNCLITDDDTVDQQLVGAAQHGFGRVLLKLCGGNLPLGTQGVEGIPVEGEARGEVVQRRWLVQAIQREIVLRKALLAQTRAEGIDRVVAARGRFAVSDRWQQGRARSLRRHACRGGIGLHHFVIGALLQRHVDGLLQRERTGLLRRQYAGQGNRTRKN